jgi:hypothetical protein
MAIKRIYFFSGFIFCFSFSFLQLPCPPYQAPVFAKSHEISVYYSVKKNSLTQDYEVIITDKGDVIVYQNNKYDKPKVLNAKLSDDEWDALRELILDAEIFEFENKYVAKDNFIELDSVRLKITIDRRVKDIVISAATCPPKMQGIIDKIEAIKSRMK